MSEQAVHDWIRKTVASNDVVLFMKGTKAMPQCGFSAQVVHILGQLGVPYKDVNVLEDTSIRDGVKSFSNWPTIPQLYVKGEFIGGCDIVREMYQASGDPAASRREGHRPLRRQHDCLNARPAGQDHIQAAYPTAASPAAVRL